MPQHASTTPVIRNIAVATDFSENSDLAIAHAISLAREFGAALHFLHTARRSEFAFVGDFMVSLQDLADRDYLDLIKRLDAKHSLEGVEYYCWNTTGEIADVFEDLVRDNKIDLLVLTTNDRSRMSHLLLGSSAQEILHHALCPALVIGPASRADAANVHVKRILFATDLSNASAAAMPFVLTAARKWGADVDVLHVSSTPSATSDGWHAIEELRRKIDMQVQEGPFVKVACHILAGEPSTCIVNFAAQNSSDVIVLGLGRGRSLHTTASFSHAYDIVRQATCPVLSVR